MLNAHTPTQQELPLAFDQCQRWNRRRTSYRPAQEPIDVSEYAVEALDGDRRRMAKDFVVKHHYSGTFPYEIRSFGLFRKTSPFQMSRLVGVATFSEPCNTNSMQRWCGLPNAAGAELGRFVLLDECAGNAESWFLARALRGFKEGEPQIQCILSYSDPHPRRNALGETIFPGHRGIIYQASGAFYCGRASPKSLFINADGRALANRVLSKLRNGERGWRNAERQIAEFTGLHRDEHEPVDAYVARALGSLRKERHLGNHLFVFPLAVDRREKRAIVRLPVLQAHVLPAHRYPKALDAVAA